MTQEEIQNIVTTSIQNMQTGKQTMEQAIAEAVARTMTVFYGDVEACCCQNCGTDYPIEVEQMDKWLTIAGNVPKPYETLTV